jgi:hypothetical protein
LIGYVLYCCGARARHDITQVSRRRRKPPRCYRGFIEFPFRAVVITVIIIIIIIIIIINTAGGDVSREQAIMRVVRKRKKKKKKRKNTHTIARYWARGRRRIGETRNVNSTWRHDRVRRLRLRLRRASMLQDPALENITEPVASNPTRDAITIYNQHTQYITKKLCDSFIVVRPMPSSQLDRATVFEC